MDVNKTYAEGPEGSTLRCDNCGQWKETRRFADPHTCKTCKRILDEVVTNNPNMQ